ncbi:hypothetical protein DXG01_010775 [Tephrocybe rancida]|nr:hypothetical protein DXG01_010775 [Tephrocybe rancida]
MVISSLADIVHSMWKRRGQDAETSTKQTYLRFASRVPGIEEDIWILLTRHVTDSSRTSDYISLKVEVEDDLQGTTNFVEQTAIAAKGTYTNSTHVLVRVKVLASLPSGILSIFTSYDGDGIEVGFTIAAYASSNLDISWDETISIPPFTRKIHGILTSKNAGGNCTYPTFMSNPQYHLQIHPQRGQGSLQGSKAKLALTLQSSRETPVNISLVYSQGERIDEYVTLMLEELYTDKSQLWHGTSEKGNISSVISHGVWQTNSFFVAGNFTVILSAFEPHHMGPYTLSVDSSHPFDIKPIPQEGAGMYAKVIRGAWTVDTAAGGPTSDRYRRNPIFEIDIPALTQIKIRLQLIRPFTATSLNITIFPDSPDGTLRRHIATSGAYNDAISGVATPQLTLGAGKYLAVPSTYNPGVEVGFHLLIYTTVAGVKVSQRLQK